MKKWLNYCLALSVLIGFVFMAVVGRNHVISSTKTNQRIFQSRMVPTIMVPGSSATQERFNSTINSLNQMGSKHSLLKLTVQTDGSIKYTGQLQSGDNHPYIVIAFQNNTDSYATIKKQAKWLSKALNDLQEKYHFRNFNAIGHSNGGLDWTVYLEKYYSSSSLNIKTLMTIGTPYNFEVTDTSHQTEMLKDLIANNKALPNTLTMYNIAGTQTYDGDYIVPISSVELGKYIYQNQVAHYTQVTVSGDDAEHSDLPQNPEVLNLIAEHILKVNTKKGAFRPKG
ncbi:alpha/beta hydrolase [Streptococcus castoreus]|uniref:alpha/beta hydrolase n=1 Tax=Streptococcus castoreus TaxID=254786 RepID=UPI000485F587|nr:alpha/beta hydrolase [Streptococcus castoreus]